MKRKTLIVLDANALLHRAWHALPPSLTSPSGEVVNAVYGVSSMFLKLLKAYEPDCVVAAFDMRAPTFRHKLTDSYKATREKKPDELYAQIPMVQEVFRAFGIPSFEIAGYEADDIVGTIAQHAPKDVTTLIVTGDQDAMQLVTETTHVLYLRTGITEMIEFDPATVEKKYGFAPKYLIDYKALRGDTSDNIKGVHGIGEKTALALIQEFGTVERIYAALEHEPERVLAVAKTRGVTALTGSRETAMLAKQLTTIVTDVPLSFDFSKCSLALIDWEQVREVFTKYGFRSLLRKLDEAQDHGERMISSAHSGAQSLGTPSKKSETASTSAPSVIVVTDEKHIPDWLGQVQRLGIVVAAQDGTLFSTGKVFHLADVDAGVSVSIAEHLVPKLAALFANERVLKLCYHAKDVMHALAAHGVMLAGLVDDITVAAYLVEAGTQTYDLDTLTRKYLIAPAHTGSAQALDVGMLVPKLRAAISEQGMLALYETIEMPTIGVLFGMERVGIALDTEYLKELSERLTKRLTALEKKIMKMAGEEFNVNSPAQLAVILFEKLGLPTQGLKKTKTGISTAQPELEKIQDEHPIIASIFEQRELQKLLSTYIDTLPSLIGKDGRIHTTYQQTVAATGRLSSIAPNLQNIPIQTDLGNEIRKAFVAGPGMVLVAADYSQIQLRIAAHLSKDKHMMDAFRRGADIHTTTAARIFGVSDSEVTSEMRRQAKVINFGILYGMGPQALARGTGMPLAEAKQFIAKYFTVHPGIKSYMEETKLLARTQGYVETPFGRRRSFPDIHSGVPMLVASAERMAMNMPIQGMEADIMKLAMLKVSRELGSVSDGSRMLLQVHDELVLEVPKKDVEKVRVFLERAMREVADLSVPVVVNVETGLNWGEME